MTKRKISDIFEERVVSRKERNENGEWEIVEKVFHKKRPVGTASTMLRVIHFYVDGFIFSILIIPFQVYALKNPSPILNLLPILMYFLYYILLEFYFQKTLGKLVTKSIVVNEYGERPDFKSICYRALTRLVPFEPFSFFWSKDARWWHDSWAKTYVISESELSLINRIKAGEQPRKADEGQWDEWHKWQ